MTSSHKPTLWVNVRSVLQWIVGGIVLFLGMVSVLVARIFVGPFKVDAIVRPFVKAMVFISGVKIKSHGIEKIDQSKAYLFVFNHINFFDHMIIYSQLHMKMRGVEKASHFSWPVYGQLIHLMGQIPIAQKGDTRSAIQSLEKLKTYFEKGISIVVVPEGTRTKDGELQRFKKGAFHLAIQSQATLLPIVFVGAYEFMKKGDWRLYPRQVDMFVEDPIPTKGLTESDIIPLRDQTRKIIASRLDGSKPA